MHFRGGKRIAVIGVGIPKNVFFQRIGRRTPENERNGWVQKIIMLFVRGNSTLKLVRDDEKTKHKVFLGNVLHKEWVAEELDTKANTDAFLRHSRHHFEKAIAPSTANIVHSNIVLKHLPHHISGQSGITASSGPAPIRDVAVCTASEVR